MLFKHRHYNIFKNLPVIQQAGFFMPLKYVAPTLEGDYLFLTYVELLS